MFRECVQSKIDYTVCDVSCEKFEVREVRSSDW